MNFIINEKIYDNNNIYIMDGVSNNVIENGYFHRLIYSNSHMTLNALIFKLNLQDISITKIFNKYKITYDNKYNDEKMKRLQDIEILILNKFNLKNKVKYSIAESINTDNIKLYSDKQLNEIYDNLNIYMKISGIWVNENEYGLTFKFSC